MTAGNELMEGKAMDSVLDDGVLAYAHPGFSFTFFPHKKPKDNDQIYVREFDGVTMTVEPGTSILNRHERVGVPFGYTGRIPLLWLQSEAIRTGSPEIYLGRNLNSWLEKLGLSDGKLARLALRDQMQRISACKLTFTATDGTGFTHFRNASIVEAGSINGFDGGAESKSWNDTVRLSRDFFDPLAANPVVLRDDHIRLISAKSSSMAIDIYLWLAYHLPLLGASGRLYPWSLLYKQFGETFARERDFRRSFKMNLAVVKEAYGAASVDVREAGLMLRHSPPPGERRLFLAWRRNELAP